MEEELPSEGALLTEDDPYFVKSDILPSLSLIAKTTIRPFSARVLALKARKEIDGTGLII